MEENKITQILAGLNRLLTEEMSLHTVSYEFDKLVAQDIRPLGLSFEVIPVIVYYLDSELTFALHKKIEAFKTGDLQTALKFRAREKTLLIDKEGTEEAVLRKEPSCFEFTNERITAYLGRSEKDRLLKCLIEGYNLEKK